MRRLVLLAFGPLLVLGLVSCSSKAPTVSQAGPALTSVHLPSEILGLHVVRENVQANLKGINQSYLQSIGLFSFREQSKLLRATIEIGIFNKLAPATEARFRSNIVGGFGGSVPLQLRVGRTKVYLASGQDQNSFTWFDDKAFYVLSVRSDFPFQRTLLRDLLNTAIVR